MVSNQRITAVKALPVPRQAVKRCSVCGNLIFDGMEVGHECPYCGAHSSMYLPIAQSDRVERTFKADYFVCALDGPGLNSFVGKNLEAFGNHDYFRKAADIKSKSVFVCNMWFEGKGYWERALKSMNQAPSPVLVTTGFENLSVMINRSVRIRGTEGKQWSWSNEYNDKDVTVLEVHLPRAEAVASLSSKEIAALCYKDLKSFIRSSRTQGFVRQSLEHLHELPCRRGSQAAGNPVADRQPAVHRRHRRSPTTASGWRRPTSPPNGRPTCCSKRRGRRKAGSPSCRRRSSACRSGWPPPAARSIARAAAGRLGARQDDMKIIGFAGYSGSGKTTLIEQLIPRFTGKGLRVSLIKHAHHTFEIDKPGKDSFRHREAGASEVMLVSSGRQRWCASCVTKRNRRSTSSSRMSPCDLMLVEGFKTSAIPKIEVYRPALGKPRLPRETPNIVALACDAGGRARLRRGATTRPQ